MADEQIVDVSYRGLAVGSRLRLFEFGPTTAYLETPQPMPVGSVVSIQADGLVFDATVLRVQEQVAGAEHPPGMCVRVDALEGALADWWKQNTTREDPVIPEPAIEVLAPSAETPAVEADPAPAAESDQAADSGPSDGVPAGEAAESSARKTSVMDVAEIQAVIAAGGDVADLTGDDGDPDARATLEMPAADVQEILGTASADDSAETDSGDDDKPNGKKKKRRRRKRKTKAP